MTSAKLWFAHRQCSERQTNSRSIQWLHCAPTSVWSLLVNHAEQPSLSDPYRWIRGLVFTREDEGSGRGTTRRRSFSFSSFERWPLQKKKRNLEERGERENELTNSKSFVCRVFLSPSVRRGTAKERERERKRKGGAREDLWTGSTPMHLPTPFASSCSLVAGNYRRGNFWYDSNDGKESLLDLDAFFLPFLFFCFFLFFFFRPWPSLHTAWFGRVNRLTRLRIINSNQRAKMLNLSTLSFFLTLVSTFPPMLFETF